MTMVSVRSDLAGLPMAVAQHETCSASCSAGLHLDELAFRLGQRISARKKVPDDGLQMAVVQETPRHKGTHPRRRFGGVEPILPVAAHGVPDFHLLLLIRIRVLAMECSWCGKHWTSGRGWLLAESEKLSPTRPSACYGRRVTTTVNAGLTSPPHNSHFTHEASAPLNPAVQQDAYSDGYKRTPAITERNSFHLSSAL